jgi:hypothetical protein
MQALRGNSRAAWEALAFVREFGLEGEGLCHAAVRYGDRCSFEPLAGLQLSTVAPRLCVHGCFAFWLQANDLQQTVPRSDAKRGTTLVDFASV